MQTKEKIGVAIVVILIVIYVIVIWSGHGSTNPKVNINCNTFCHPTGQDSWTFPTANINDTFLTQDECVAACQARYPK